MSCLPLLACVPTRPAQSNQACAHDEQCPADGRHFCNIRTSACEPCDGPCATVTVLDVSGAGTVASSTKPAVAADTAATSASGNASASETVDATPDAAAADTPFTDAADADALPSEVSTPADVALPADTTEPAWKPNGKDYWGPSESCKDHCEDLGPPGCYCDSFCLTAEPPDCCNDKLKFCPAGG